MKKYAVILFIAFFHLSAPCVHAQNHLQTGRSLFFANGELSISNAVAARPEFEAAVAQNPSDQSANLFLAITRLIFLLDNTAAYAPGIPIENAKELLDSFGVADTGRDLFDWTAAFPKNPKGNYTVPATCPNGLEIQTFLHSIILPEIVQALQNLSVIDPSFILLINSAETGQPDNIDIDYGDILMFRSVLYATKAFLLVLSSYDLNVDIYRIVDKIDKDLFNANTDLIDQYTEFLKRLDIGGPRMLEARGELVSAIDNYLQASDFIRSEADDQSDDLIALTPEDLQNEADFRNQVAEIKASIQDNREAVLELDNAEGSGRIDFNRIFGNDLSGSPHFREFFPLFDSEGHIHTRTFPDTTFGGILPDCADELSLVEFTPFRLPIVFPVFVKTMVMDGNEDDWQTVFPMLPSYFEYKWSWNWDIEYVKVARDKNHFYWMIKFQSDAVPDCYYYFSLWNEEDVWNKLYIYIWQDSTYQASNWSMNMHYTGTEEDYGFGEIVEGRVPISYIELDGTLGAYVSGYYWNPESYTSYSASVSGSSMLTGTEPSIATAGADRVVVDSVTLQGEAIIPERSITSWQWSLRHTSDPSQHRTATGPNPTINDLTPGYYEVVLTATDDLGQTSTDTLLLAVLGSNEMVTREECDLEVFSEMRKWIGPDEKLGLEEAIRALQVVSGLREED